jgi:hypothetical protein
MAKIESEGWGEVAGFRELSGADEWPEKWVETRGRCEAKFALGRADRFCGYEESRGVLLSVSCQTVSRSTMTMGVAQFGQRKQVG